MMNKEKSAAIQVAHAGYDVWLGNNRGCVYSRGHVSLNANKDFKEFYDYSFYELGKYDAPAQIDFVRSVTGHDKISYIGHSQGTSQMFSALAEGHGNLKDKINLFVALCPITNLGLSSAGFMDFGAKWYGILESTFNSLNIRQIKGPGWNRLSIALCTVVPCDLFDKMSLPSAESFNDPRVVETMQTRGSSSASSKQILHYL